MARSYEHKRNIPMFMAAVLFCLTMLSVCLLCGLFARYTNESNSGNIARAATFNITGDGFTQKASIDAAMNPGDIENSNYISIRNQSEVSVRYTLKFLNTTQNLPLAIKIGDNSTVSLDTEYSYSDTLPSNGDLNNINFSLVWDANENSVDYCGKLDNILVTVEAVQVD